MTDVVFAIVLVFTQTHTHIQRKQHKDILIHDVSGNTENYKTFKRRKKKKPGEKEVQSKTNSEKPEKTSNFYTDTHTERDRSIHSHSLTKPTHMMLTI